MTTILEEIQEEKQPVQQEQEYLTVDDIMPNWSHMFDLLNKETVDYFEVTMHLEKTKIFMASYRKCAVGESHKFGDHYYYVKVDRCETCVHHANVTFPELLKNIEDNKLYVGKEWRKNWDVQNFVEHWNSEHKEVTLRK